jgi:uncharacterized protein YutE (UPF0331/DUF86 family)
LTLDTIWKRTAGISEHFMVAELSGKVDRIVVESQLRFLREYLSDLAEYESIPLPVYRKNKKDQRFVERTLHLACECCMDAAAHVISRMGYREPRDNKDLFQILSENNVLSESVSGAMIKMSQFRNIVVHDYTRIDPAIIVGILRENLVDFKRFAAEVIRFMDTLPAN